MARELLTKIKDLRSKERLITPDEAWVRATRQTLLLRAQQALPPSGQVKGLGLVKEVMRAAFPQGVAQYVTRPIFASLSFLVAIMGGSMMSVSAAERSLPGDLLYSLKLVTEQARMVMTSDKGERLKLKTEFTGRRVDELRAVVTTPTADTTQRVTEVAGALKRDMDTLKQQLTDVSNEATPAAAVEAARSVDKKSNEVIVALQETKQQLSPEAKGIVTDAQSAAAETSVKAIEVLATQHQVDGGSISAADVADAIKEHAKIVTDVTAVPLPVNATSTASGTTIIVITAPSTTSTSPLPLALELGSSTGTSAATGTLPGILDQVKDATAQAFALQKAKDQQAIALSQSTSTPPEMPPDGSPLATSGTPAEGIPLTAPPPTSTAPTSTSTKK